MLRDTIELVAATRIWSRLDQERRAILAGQFVMDKTKAGKIAGSMELNNFSEEFGEGFQNFLRRVMENKTEPILLTEEEVTDKHNELRRPPWNTTIRQVRGLAIKQGKFLKIKHVSVGKIEVM